MTFRKSGRKHPFKRGRIAILATIIGAGPKCYKVALPNKRIGFIKKDQIVFFDGSYTINDKRLTRLVITYQAHHHLYPDHALYHHDETRFDFSISPCPDPAPALTDKNSYIYKSKTPPLPYQRHCWEKLIRLKVGAIFSDMGTGKTKMAIDLAEAKPWPILVFCPASLIDNWRDQLAEHATTPARFCICSIQGFSRNTQQTLPDVSKSTIIIDESSLIKSETARRTRHIIALIRHAPFKLILDGLPVTENPVNLFYPVQGLAPADTTLSNTAGYGICP